MNIDLPIVYRQCTKCGCDITYENKTKCKLVKSGIGSICIDCRKAYDDLRSLSIRQGKYKPKNSRNGGRFCIYCGVKITPENTAKNKYSSTGLHNRCKICSNLKKVEWEKNNPEKNCLNTHKYKTSQRNFPHTFTEDEWLLCTEYFDNKCAFCGKERKLSMDHFIPISNPLCPGTVKENIIPLCRSCNSSKNSHNAYRHLVKQYGVQKAVLLYNRIQVYFEWITQR